MARSKAATESADDVVARGADVPLALAQASQPRDALVDPRDGDYIPDVDTKGYHVGTVRQPAEPVLTRDGTVTFESTAEAPSKFDDGEGTTLIERLKAAHNEVDNGRESDLARVEPPATDPYSGEPLEDKG